MQPWRVHYSVADGVTIERNKVSFQVMAVFLVVGQMGGRVGGVHPPGNGGGHKWENIQRDGIQHIGYACHPGRLTLVRLIGLSEPRALVLLSLFCQRVHFIVQLFKCTNPLVSVFMSFHMSMEIARLGKPHRAERTAVGLLTCKSKQRLPPEIPSPGEVTVAD